MANLAQEVPAFTAPSFLAITPTALGQVRLNARQWFFRLVNQEERHGLLELVWTQVTQRFAAYRDASTLQAVAIDQPSRALHERLRADYPALIPDSARKRHFYFQHAPLFKVMGGWLDGVTSIAHAWRADSGQLLKIHALMVGGGYPQRSQSRLFDQAAHRVGMAVAEVFSHRFCDDPAIEDAAFELPVFLLALACFPRAFHAETLGVNLALCDYVDQLNALREGDTALFGQPQATAYHGMAVSALDLFLQRASVADSARVGAGYRCALAMIETHERHLAQVLADPQRFNEHAAMVALIDRLGRHGCGYHQRGQLAGEPIDHWLAPETFCPHATVKALADSRYVRPGQPARSALLNIIGKPTGSMFGVFSGDDIAVVERWVSTLAPTTERPTANAEGTPPTPVAVTLCEQALAQANRLALKKYRHLSLRALYPLFLQIDQAPDALPAARAFADAWLARHRLGLRREGLPFSPYSHEALAQWLEAQHARQVQSYRPLVGAPEETREDIVADALSLAPLTLIDGAWLRQVVAPASVTTPIGALLYRTLIDELGQGDSALHHGNIYQQLLASMGQDVGSFVEPGFATARHFEDDDLRVPVFWLAISLFPQRYQPETLGLNLAMELSGVGGEYRRSADVLRHYGFSALFTDLHNTIDNVVSGHTAWAIEAIRQHLDDALQRGGEQEQARHWERIWVGYRALSPPSGSPLQWVKDRLHSIRHTFTQRRGAP
ncbi:iron-containing redox enzyme family protein [Pseudomonas entomophila]|uniref:iron-containing redox enzyme family protein n=1 Tax=Pseudomonas entomophila TaxID=312306 RepID=UPI0024066E11|nr:iron-containing redox enzyme family protein [Pseudomonas entomophila]MDF9619786.1 iron-containing redox enzyme family protein [Pseudomonas entomophila]